jgi:signal peptidase II
MRQPRLLRLGLVVAAAVIALDQATKWIILSLVMAPPRPIAVTPFFNLVLVWNPGISFGLLRDHPSATRWVLAGAAVVIAAVLGFWLRRADRALPAVALGAVIGGALGNVIDRLVHGRVVDFLDLHALGYHWPAFNIADSAITLGVAALVVDGLFARPPGAGAASPTERQP